MNNFEKVIKKLKKIGNERPDPEDHLYNIVKCVEDVDLNDEEWCNFYRYITCQDKSDFEYLPRNQIVTLGDLGDEKLQEMQKDMGYGDDQHVQYYQNGIETTMIVKNVGSIIKDNGKECVVGSCEELSCEPQRTLSESCSQGSFKNVQEEKCCSEKESG